MSQFKLRSNFLVLALAVLTAVPAALISAPPSRAADTGEFGISFDGGNDYVTFGDASSLRLSTFTIETWFRRDGSGVSVSTGTGGVVALPLVTKGRHGADNAGTDVNWFLGIDAARDVLVADFEESAAGTSGDPGLNHPVAGTTFVHSGVWNHAAATYDGTTWRLYLNGVLDATLNVGQPAATESTEHAALGTTVKTVGGPSGYFAGAMDETRIWNVARSAQQIAASYSGPVVSAPGLVGRWGMNEGSGTTIASSAGTVVNGTLVNGPAWVAGAPAMNPPTNEPPTFDQNLPNRTDAEGATINIDAGATDPDGDTLTYAASGLPAGLAINSATGLISGKISAGAATASPYSVSVTVRDGPAVDATDTFSWTITAPAADTTAPTVTPPSPALAAGSTISAGKVPVRVAWSGSDAKSGVARYELHQRVNTGPYTVVNANLTQPAVTLNLAPGHTYRYAVRAFDKAGNVSGFAFGPALALSGHQESSTAIRYIGTWGRATNTAWWGGAVRYATSSAARASFTFTGRSVGLVTTMSPSRGKAAIYVNGAYVKTIDLYSASWRNGAVAWTQTWSTSARRTVEIRVLGTAGRPRVDLDGWVVGN